MDFCSARARIPASACREQPTEEEDLIYAVEVGAFVGRLAMGRELVFFEDAHYLYFQRTVPSFTSSTMIPESASCLRISSERLKSRRFLAAWRSSLRTSISSGAMRGFGEPNPSLASPSASSSGSTDR